VALQSLWQSTEQFCHYENLTGKDSHPPSTGNTSLEHIQPRRTKTNYGVTRGPNVKGVSWRACNTAQFNREEPPNWGQVTVATKLWADRQVSDI